jgi:hypothetical protein
MTPPPIVNNRLPLEDIPKNIHLTSNKKKHSLGKPKHSSPFPEREKTPLMIVTTKRKEIKGQGNEEDDKGKVVSESMAATTTSSSATTTSSEGSSCHSSSQEQDPPQLQKEEDEDWKLLNSLNPGTDGLLEYASMRVTNEGRIAGPQDVVGGER